MTGFKSFIVWLIKIMIPDLWNMTVLYLKDKTKKKEIKNGITDMSINPNEQITPNFNLNELLVHLSQADLETVNNQIVSNLRLLVNTLLQPIRDRFGKVIITSGFRTPEHNREIGGAVNSFHLYGQAADFIAPQANLFEVFCWIRHNLPMFTELILYNGHIHIAYDPMKQFHKVKIKDTRYSVEDCDNINSGNYHMLYIRYENLRYVQSLYYGDSWLKYTVGILLVLGVIKLIDD